jgi:hypothetical protein
MEKTVITKSLLILSTAALLQSCSSLPPEPAQIREDWGVTSRIAPPDVYSVPAQAALRLTSSSASAWRGVFDEAQSVHPLVFHSISTQQRDAASPPRDGYTLTFYDFYGASFAYVTSVTRAKVALTPSALLERHDPRAAAPKDERTWQDATYVSGANTRRTPLGNYYHGFPVLYGLFGAESKKAGFDANAVERLVMPAGNAYWALTKSGRYFDLMQYRWVDDKTVTEARRQYDDMLRQLEASATFDQHATKLWQEAETKAGVQPSACPAGSSSCVRSVSASLRPQVLQYPPDSQRCRPTWFLWWQTGVECDYDAVTGYLPLEINVPYLQDNDQKWYQGAYTGCGPTMLTNMLWWWQTFKGKAGLMRNPSPGSAYDTFGTTQIELIADTNAYIDGIGRSALGGDISDGLEKYLLRNYSTLKSQAVMGIGSTLVSEFYFKLKEKMAINEIVGVGHFVVGYGGHFGIMERFVKAPFGGLTVSMIRPPAAVFGNMNFGEFFSTSSVHWIATR